MASLDFKTYIDNHYLKKGDDWTHTRIGDKLNKINGGTYTITDQRQFLESYYNDVFRDKRDEYMTERQLIGDDKRLVVDIDLRYSSDITTRQHTPDHITDVIDLYLKAIQKLCEIADGCAIEVFTMEKPSVNCLDNKTKDGIHLIFGIALNSDIQNTIRDDVMPKIANIWNDLPFTNTIDEVLDKGIMEGSVNWQLYGSKKPNNEAYRLTNVENWIWREDNHDWDNKTIKDFDVKANFKRLSVRCPNIQKGILREDAKIIPLKAKSKLIVRENIDDEDVEDVEERTYTKTELQEIINGLPKEAYICGGGNYCFNIVCALKKAGATRQMVKKLCEKAGEDYNDEWFKSLWKQDTSKYAFDIQYVRAKSSWREPSLGCLINLNTDELIVNSGNVYDNTEYKNIKKNYELNNFFLEDKVVWVCNEKNNDDIKKFLVYAKQQIMDKYAHLNFNHIIKGVATEVSFMKYWMADPLRRSYKSADVFPHDIICPKNIYNLWSGFGIENTILPENYDTLGKTDNIKQLLKYLCEDSIELYDYFIKFLAHMFKYPSTKEKVAFFFTGEMGVGKSTLKTLLNLLFGNDLYTEPDNADKLFQRFNKAFRLNKIAIVLDEAESMKKNAKSICGLITNDVMNIEEKNEPLMTNLKCLGRLIIMSDSADIIKIEPTDRRFIVSNPYVFADKDKKTEFFNAVYADLKDMNIIRAFYDELLTIDIDKDYNFQLARPITEYYKMLKSSNVPILIKFLHDADIESALTENKYDATPMYKHFENWCCSVGIKYETSNTKFGLDINLHLLKYDFAVTGIKKVKGKKNNHYVVDIETLKQYIETKFGYEGES